jgi:hypothetical protein
MEVVFSSCGAICSFRFVFRWIWASLLGERSCAAIWFFSSVFSSPAYSRHRLFHRPRSDLFLHVIGSCSFRFSSVLAPILVWIAPKLWASSCFRGLLLVELRPRRLLPWAAQVWFGSRAECCRPCPGFDSRLVFSISQLIRAASDRTIFLIF